MGDKSLIVLGMTSLATTTTGIKQTVSVFNYKLWAGSQYHIDMSDIARFVGFIAGAAAIYQICILVKRRQQKRQELKRITRHDHR